MAILERFKQAWRVFTNKDPTKYEMDTRGISYSMKPDRPRYTRGIDRTIITAIYTKIAVDCACTRLQHVQLDEEEQYIGNIKSSLNYCFTQMANADQTGRDFLRDAVISLLNDGTIAIVPITTDRSIVYNDTFEIYEIRVADIVTWYPKAVKVRIYDQDAGTTKEVTLPKSSVAIVENPFYAVMNESNSVLKKLIDKLALMDTIDENNASGKLDLIIQLPYVVKSELQKEQAELRRNMIETQLVGSKYGIAYIDGTEHITQLNRPVENNLMTQVDYYTELLYGQMGISKEIMNGTATEEQKIEYFNHIIEPILTAISEAMTYKFLSLNARTRGQAIRFYRKPFQFVSYTTLADLAQKLSQNAIITPNEFRQVLGLKPSNEAIANELSNKNLPPEEMGVDEESVNPLVDMSNFQNDLNDLQEIDGSIDEIENMLHMDVQDKVIIHYASQYYDPQKAHQYYEEHKQLKGYANRYGGVGGRGGTTGLNEKGREIAKITKYNINKERQLKDEQVKNSLNQKKENAKQERIKAVNQAKENIKSSAAKMLTQLQSMNEAQRKHAAIKIRGDIKKLRAEADQLREQLSEHYRQVSLELSEAAKAERDKNRSEADERYAAEIQKMLQDPSLVGGKGKGKSSKKESEWRLWSIRKNQKK